MNICAGAPHMAGKCFTEVMRGEIKSICVQFLWTDRQTRREIENAETDTICNWAFHPKQFP